MTKQDWNHLESSGVNLASSLRQFPYVPMFSNRLPNAPKFLISSISPKNSVFPACILFVSTRLDPICPVCFKTSIAAILQDLDASEGFIAELFEPDSQKL